MSGNEKTGPRGHVPPHPCLLRNKHAASTALKAFASRKLYSCVNSKLFKGPFKINQTTALLLRLAKATCCLRLLLRSWSALSQAKSPYPPKKCVNFVGSYCSQWQGDVLDSRSYKSSFHFCLRLPSMQNVVSCYCNQ